MHWFRSHLPKHGYSPANTCAWGAGPFLVLAPGLGDTTLSESIHFFLSLQSFHGGKGLRNCRPGCSQSWFCHLLAVWFCPSSSQHQFPHLYCACVHAWTCLLCIIPVGFSGQIIYDSINLQKPIRVGEESRWRRNRTGRSLSRLQIHRKNNRTVNKVYKTTSDRLQRTSGAQKSSPLSSKGGRTKILKIKKGHKRTRDGDPPRERSLNRGSFQSPGNPRAGRSGEVFRSRRAT